MFIKKFIQAAVLVYLYSQMVLCDAPTEDFKNLTSLLKLGKGPERFIRLYNYKSGGYVRIFKKNITANGHRNDIHTILLMESIDKEIYIRSNLSKKYICFTKIGKLRVRNIPHKNPRKKKLCRFTECIYKGLGQVDYRLCSVANGTWKIGFDYYGRPVPGSQAELDDFKDERFIFMKQPVKETGNEYGDNGEIIKDSVLAKKAADKEERHHYKAGSRRNNKKRRRRRRSTTRAVAKLTTSEVQPTASSVQPIR